MKPDRDPVDHDEERAAKAESKPAGSGDVALDNDANRHCRVVTFPELHNDETRSKDDKDDKKGDDAAIGPGVG